MATNPGNAGGEGDGGGMKATLAAVITVAALAGLAIFIIFLLSQLSNDELQWSRSVYLFGAVEAIAFAAVGWLFGKEVHREQAKSAEKRADNAEQKAEAATTDAQQKAQVAATEAQRGRSLRDAIEAKKSTQPARTAAYGPLGANAPAAVTAAAAQDIDELADLARRLYPDG